MDLAQLTARAMEINARFAAVQASGLGRAWTKEEVMQGFVVDVGDLMRLVMARGGLRPVDDLERKLGHELADCLWSVLVLAQLYGVDLEAEFLRTMAGIEATTAAKLQKKV